jgi:hypothetical protein
MVVLAFLLGFVAGMMFLAWVTMTKLKTHDCAWYDGQVRWIERTNLTSIPSDMRDLYPHPSQTNSQEEL